MSGFTPGPWETHWEQDATGYPLFSIHGMCGSEKWDKPVLDANARLIAAAPDLLEALEGCLHFEDGFIRQSSVIGMALMEWREAARAAIAKATGDAP